MTAQPGGPGGTPVGRALVPFGPEIWIAEGPVAPFHGFAYPTRMAVIRLSDGGLFIWSPVELSAALQAAIDVLGPVHFLVAPNALHHLFLAPWVAAYPQARLYAPPGLAKKRKDLTFDAALADAPAPEWAKDIDQVEMRGSFYLTEIVFFHRTSGTVLFADLIQNFPRDWFTGWRGVLARFGGIVAPHPGTPIDWRATFLNRQAARAALRRVLTWPIERVVIAHGDLPREGGVAFVRTALTWLGGIQAPNETSLILKSRSARPHRG
jgi:hypothetical protein